MKIDDLAKLLGNEKFGNEGGGSAFAYAVNSKGKFSGIVKGNMGTIVNMLLNAMIQDKSTKDVILLAAKNYKKFHGKVSREG